MKANVVAGAIYTTHTLLFPEDFLKKYGAEANVKNVNLVRTIGGGLVGLSLASYLALRNGSKSANKVAIGGLVGALAVYFGNNLIRVSKKSTNTLQARIDVGVAFTLLAANAAFFYYH